MESHIQAVRTAVVVNWHGLNHGPEDLPEQLYSVTHRRRTLQKLSIEHVAQLEERHNGFFHSTCGN